MNCVIFLITVKIVLKDVKLVNVLVSYPYPALSVALNVVLEVTQTGETCPIENLNMGKLSCPPAVGRGGVRS